MLTIKKYKMLGALLLLVSGLLAASCAFSVAPTSSKDTDLSLELSAYPNQVSIEDSTATAEIWATVREGDRPIKDNTLVKFATTVGTITSESLTRDGLAVALLTGPGDGRPRQAEVVAQAITIRDTLDLDFVILEESEP